jgi:hypothetical protein
LFVPHLGQVGKFVHPIFEVFPAFGGQAIEFVRSSSPPLFLGR